MWNFKPATDSLLVVDPAQTGAQVALFAAGATGAIAPAAAFAMPGGTYVLLGAAPPDWTVFATQLGRLLAAPAVAGTRLLWIQNPGDAPGTWRYVLSGPAPGGRLAAAVHFAFQNYGLLVPAGSSVTSADGTAIQIAPPAGGALLVTADHGALALPIVRSGSLTVPLQGPRTGCLCFPVYLDPGATAPGRPQALRTSAAVTAAVPALAPLSVPVAKAALGVQPDDGQPISLPAQGLQTLVATVSGTWTGTLSFAGSTDGVHYAPLGGTSAASANGGFALAAGQSTSVRASAAGLTMGTALVTIDPAPAVIDALDIGCRFYAPDTSNAYGAGFVISQRYPIFDTTQGGITLFACLDPLAPSIAFGPGSRSEWTFDTTPGTPIQTFYRTVLSQPVTIVPQPGSRLVFQGRPRALRPTPRDALTLVPDGPFQIVTGAGTTQVLCGLSGHEYVELSGAGPYLLTFAAGQPAYAPALGAVPGQGGRTPDEPLTAIATTSYAAITGPAGTLIGYYAQAEGAALHGLNQPGDTLPAGTPLFPYFEVVAEYLPQAAGPATSYPLVPYAGLLGLPDLRLFGEMEAQVLSPNRRAIIHAQHAPAPVNLAGTLTAITPQGYAARFSADKSSWETLQIGRATVPATQSAPAQVQALQFGTTQAPLSGNLRASFLANQQFIVISDPSSIRDSFLANNLLTIDGWTFQMHPDLWQDHGTILIIKNSFKTLETLVADTGTWVLGDVFNSSVVGTQVALQRIFQDAEAQNAQDEATPSPTGSYEFFVRTILKDPEWNGVLFLNCPVPLSGLPDALQALSAGINSAQFYAHHLGLNQTPINHPDLSLNDSSAFGLIRYDGTGQNGVPTGQQYGFAVQRLHVRFENSRVKDFSSTVTLTLDQLFGAPTYQGGRPDPGRPADPLYNAITLLGALQTHDGVDAYVFGESTPTTFALDDTALDSVIINRAAFSTGGSKPTTPPASPAPSGWSPRDFRFSLWGALKFKVLQAVDLLSYDALAYSNLGVVMTFDPTQPALPPIFTFDATGLALDLAHSQARAGSLAAEFPLKLRGLLTSAAAGSSGNATPEGLGYLAVHTPVQPVPLGSAFYGLAYDLNLGTLGALGPAGTLTAGFAVMWSPATTPDPAHPPDPAVMVGLKLPGFSSGSLNLPLMNLLKLKIASQQLTVGGFQPPASPPTGTLPPPYVLRLNGVSLSFFGIPFPPGVTFDFYLFGDPSGSGSSALGWFGDFKP